MSYEFRQDGKIFGSADKRLYEGVTAAEPIVLEFPRVEGSLYELDVVIEDTGGVTLHNSSLKIYPPKQEQEIET